MRYLKYLIPCLTALFLTACEKPSPQEFKDLLKKCNPDWKGEFATGNYSQTTPVFDFDRGYKYNAVAVSGKELRDLSPFSRITLRLFSLHDTEFTSADFMRKFKWEPDAIIDLQNCPKLSDLRALGELPVSVLSMVNVPLFTDTSVLHSKIRSATLIQTGVCKLDFPHPEELKNLCFMETKEADLSQIGKMTKLNSLTLKNVRTLDGIAFSHLARLEDFTLTNSAAEKIPLFKPDILRSVSIEDCPNIRDLNVLSGKLLDSLFLIRSGDPGKLLANVSDIRVNLLVIKGVEVSDISFLKRIKDLNRVRFQNCKGLPEHIDLPFVEVIVENR